jgi:hypothetical protein
LSSLFYLPTKNYDYCAPFYIRVVLKETGWKSVDWIHLAQDMDKWQTLVNTVLNLWVLLDAKNSLTRKELSTIVLCTQDNSVTGAL